MLCAGSHREMGVAQGKALAGRIAAARDLLARLDAFRIPQPWWLPYPLYLRLAQRRARRLLGRLAAETPEAAERLEGIAAGSGLPLGAIALLNLMEAVLSSLSEVTAVPPSAACSAVAVTGERSSTGEPILARNFDYLPVTSPFYTLRESRPEGEFASIEFTAAPLAGAIDGVNEHGLAVTYDYAFARDLPPGRTPISMAIARALATCRTVEEAARAIREHPRWGGGLLMLADAGGDIASLELANTRAELRRPPGAEGILHHTNCYLTPALREVEIDGAAVYTDRAPSPLVGTRPLESPEMRDARLAELLSDRRSLDAARLAAVLADHGPSGVPGDNTLCMHGCYWSTTATLLLFPRSQRIRVSFGPACQARFVDHVLGQAAAPVARR